MITQNANFIDSFLENCADEKKKFCNVAQQIIELLRKWTRQSYLADQLVDFLPFYKWVNNQLLESCNVLKDIWKKPGFGYVCTRPFKSKLRELRLDTYGRPKETDGELTLFKTTDKIEYRKFVHYFGDYLAYFDDKKMENSLVTPIFDRLELALKLTRLVQQLLEVGDDIYHLSQEMS